MRPIPGIDVVRIAGQLDEQINEASRSEMASDYDAVLYVRWAHAVEQLLRSSFVDVPLDRLYTEQFWRAQGPILFRAVLVRQELDRQRQWLTAVRDTIRTMAARFGGSGSAIAVLDTNVLLHHKPLTDVDWPTIVDEPQVMLAVPIRVVHEMDGRKYVRTKGGDRARSRIKLLADAVTGGEVRPGVTVEIVETLDLDPDAARRHPIPADAEIVETCEALTAYAGTNPVCLVTGDYAMQIAAENDGLRVRRMPEDTMQPLGAPDSDEPDSDSSA